MNKLTMILNTEIQRIDGSWTFELLKLKKMRFDDGVY
jgi:hypothetical protein